jgi:hypothetical protein
MPEPHESTTYDGPIELAFDITKASGQIRFLGLLDKPNQSDNELTGLFDWICQACKTVNRDTVTLKPEQPFLTKWSCTHCSRATLVRFRARAGTEWVAQHTLAVTGKSFYSAAEEEQAGVHLRPRGKPPRRGSQTMFAWIAVPSLAVIILLGVLDMRRVSNSVASPRTAQQPHRELTLSQQRNSTPSSRIVGYWISEARDHVVYFGPIDPVTRTGTYTRVSRGNHQAKTVRFTVFHEETRGDQLVIREEPEAGRPDSAVDRSPRPSVSPGSSEAVEVTLNVPRGGETMTRVDIRDGEPVMTVYHSVQDETTP